MSYCDLRMLIAYLLSFYNDMPVTRRAGLAFLHSSSKYKYSVHPRHVICSRAGKIRNVITAT